MKKNTFFNRTGSLMQVFAGLAVGLIISVALIQPYKTYGATVASVLTATNRTALITNACRIRSISVLTATLTNIAAATFGFLDGPGTTNAHSANAIAVATTNQAFTNYSYTLAGVSNYVTNIMGAIQTNFYLALTRSTNAQAAAYVNYPRIAVLTALSNVNNTIVSVEFSGNQFNSKGLIVTNQPSSGTIIQIEYDDLN